MSAFTYLLRCADGSLYCGATKDLPKRVLAHNSGKGAKFTRGRRPVKLILAIMCAHWSDALRLERAIKYLPRERKLNLLRSEEARRALLVRNNLAYVPIHIALFPKGMP